MSHEQPYHLACPGRVELLGNHTDYNEGVVLSAAINYAVTTRGEAGRRTPGDGFFRDFSPEPVDASLDALISAGRRVVVGELCVGSCWHASCARKGMRLGGFNMQVESDLPAGAGLSSSAALEVATAKLLTKLYFLGNRPVAAGQDLPPRGKRFRRGQVRVARSGVVNLRPARTGGVPGLPFGERSRTSRCRRTARCSCSTAGSSTGSSAANTTSGASNVSPPPARSACRRCAT